MPSDPQILESIFLALVATEESARPAALEAMCNGDAELKREVQSLLRFHDAPDGGALDQSPLIHLTAGLAVSLDENRLPPRPNAGGFTLQSVLGSGGMGVVYVAQQHRPKRTIALKVIRRSAMSEQIHRRFDHEAEVLARLQHPGIAQIFETGFADFGHGPQPFIAMELVPGRNLVQFARERELGVRAQLELIAHVCDAVQHAHQRGVIHRDLKPANILILDQTEGLQPGGPQPKILDFGVARVVDSENQLTTLRSGVGQLIGTLAYMSPEQVLADQRDIDTRSDVYALGVILYELLAGRLPHDVASRSIPEAVRTIRDDHPARLSAINRSFRGDIDTIVTKALNKDPTRRYQSAAELGADLRRYLASEPIIARRPSAMYQFSRFARRNKAMLAAVAALVTVLVAGTIVSVSQAIKATTARDAAVDAQRGAEASAKRADAQTEQALHKAYLANIAAADAALQKNDIVSARRRLQAAPEGMRRNWEWRYLDAQLEDSIATLEVPGSSAMYAARFSPAGTRFATGSFDHMLRIWDFPKREVIATFSGHEQAIVDVVWSADGTKIATASRDSTARIWDAVTGETLHVLDGHHGYVNAVAFSPDGALLATGSRDHNARLWNVATGEMLRMLPGHSDVVSGVAFTPDGRHLVSSSFDGTIRIWDVVAADAPPRVLRTQFNEISAIAISPDGAIIASASRDRTVRLWDFQSGEVKQTFWGFDAAARSVAFTPDGRTLCAASDDMTVRLWNVDTGAEIAVLTGHTGFIGCVAFSPDAKWIISACTDSTGSLRIWNHPTRQITALIGHSMGIPELAWSADGRRIASGGADRRVCIWNPITGQCLAAPFANGKGVTLTLFDDERDRLITAGSDESFAVRDAQTLDTLETFDTPGGHAFVAADDARHVAWHVAASSEIIIRDLHGFDPTLTINSGVSASGCTLALDREGARIALCTNDGVLRAWNARTSTQLFVVSGQQEDVRSLRYSPDGKILATGGGARDRTIRLWDSATGEARGVIVGPQYAIESIAFTHDGARIAGGATDGSIWLWDADSADEVLVLRGHSGPVMSLQFNPDDSTLASGGIDRTVRLWETAALATRYTARRIELENQRAVGTIVDRALAADTSMSAAIAALNADAALDAELRPAAMDVLLLRQTQRHLPRETAPASASSAPATSPAATTSAPAADSQPALESENSEEISDSAIDEKAPAEPGPPQAEPDTEFRSSPPSALPA